VKLLRLQIVALLFVPGIAHAQAWTRDAGSGYVDLTVSGLTGDAVYGLDYEAVDLPSQYSQIILSLYGEIGIVDRWLTLVVQSELLRRSALADQGATLGLGDTKVGLATGLITDPIRLTIGAYVGLPTGDPDPSAGPDADDQAHEIARSLPTGDGEWDFEPRILFGWSYSGDDWPLQHYVSAYVGYALRTNSFSDAFTYWLELGTKIPVVVLDRIWWSIRFYGVESFGGTDAPAAPGLGDGVTYTSLAFSLSAEIYGGFGLLFGVDTAFRARNIISAIPIRGGLFYQF
jgi:hypothetical protein